VISNAGVLACSPLIQPAWTTWVRNTSASMVDHWWMPPNWLGCRKFVTIEWTGILLLIAFSMSFPIVLSSTMGWNDLGVSYESLLSFGIIMENDFLKCVGQLIHALAILAMLVVHSSLFNILSRCLYERWSGPGVELLLHLLSASQTSTSENRGQVTVGLGGISLRKHRLIGLFWAELYE